MDLIINTAHHPDLLLEKTVLRRGGALIDLIELSDPERSQLDASTATAEGLVLIHTGLGGVAYLAIADLLRTHPGADGGEYGLMFSASGSAGRDGGMFAHRLLTSFSHHTTATVPFPEPFGTRRCLEVGGHHTGVPRATVGGAPVRHYLYMRPPALNLLLLGLNFARLAGALPSGLFTAGGGKVPEEPSDEPICEWVSVSRSGTRVASRTIHGRGYYAMTVAATLVFARELATRRDPQAAGVKSVEEVFVLPELAPALEEAGIIVQDQALVAAK